MNAFLTDRSAWTALLIAIGLGAYLIVLYWLRRMFPPDGILLGLVTNGLLLGTTIAVRRFGGEEVSFISDRMLHRRWLLLLVPFLLAIAGMYYASPVSRVTYSASYVFLLLLLVPIAEELFFRGVVLGFFRERTRNGIVAALICSALFALMHLSQGVNPAIVALGLSMVCCAAMLMTRNVLFPIAIHCGWNSFVTVALSSSGISRLLAAAVGVLTIAAIILLELGLGLKGRRT